MEPVAFYWWTVPVYWYGCTAAAASLLALIMLYAVLRLRRADTSVTWDLFLLAIPLGVAFSRIGHIFYELDVYMASPLRIFDFSCGGFSPYGGAVGFLLAAWVCAAVRDIPFWYLLDCLAAPVLVGLAVVQLGNFFLQLTVGTPFPPDVPNKHIIAEYIEYRYRPIGFENYEYFQPVALYQAVTLFISSLAVFVLTVAGEKRFLFNDGCIFLFSTIGIGLVRFFGGFWYLSAGAGLHVGQIVSLLAVFVAGILLYKRLKAAVEY